ncbi:hypothetical protein [Paenibacillus aceti]|uniref:Uncharacterized protein n=1 Tax=Paenibacillus aceti TaxID=1820010 RepID=A0ABQ1VYG6_9BACL|nr:hypothetical protein [Paenibacillus aceti]GGG05590.1 hypothetical protein GCM10010913_29210 [Paenibacillus aceti]
MKDDAHRYTELFLQLCRPVERWLRRLILLLVLSLCLLQLALRIPEIRHMLSSADRLEGVPIHRENRR